MPFHASGNLALSGDMGMLQSRFRNAWETDQGEGLSMLDAQQLETAGFSSKIALRRFPCESPEGDFADEARNL